VQTKVALFRPDVIGAVRRTSPRTTAPAGSFFRILLGGLYAAAFLLIVGLFWGGASFYLTPLAERAHHPGYWSWKSGGSIGRLLGITGAGMMTLMLLYSLRKRVRSFHRLGSLSRWLDVHIFLGIVGPSLVVLHSAFKVGGLVALSFWSMVAVALSGILGRYLYLQIPRTRAGEEIALGELEAADRALSDRLARDYRLNERLLKRLEELSAPAAGRGWRALADILIGDRVLSRRVRAFLRTCPNLPGPMRAEFERVLRDKAHLRRKILLRSRVQAVFHYWHVVHKPFAVVMYVFMVVHIGVALITGYGGLGAP
jgi:hypothetical protein